MTVRTNRKPLVIASRRSPLAQAQAALIRQQLEAIEAGKPPAERHIFIIKTYVTTGDRHQHGTLVDLGGKGLFTREVETALLKGEADIAVHSLKDMPVRMPEGLKTGALPAREIPYEAFLSSKAARFTDLPAGAVIGTSSVRRAAQTRHARPDLEIIPLRGNVGSRLDKLAAGQVDGTFLAVAGLRRLGLDAVPYTALSPEEMLPALCQGALLVQIREAEPGLEALLAPLTCPRTEIELTAERAMLARLDGSCQTPIAGLAQLSPVTGDHILPGNPANPEFENTIPKITTDETATSETATGETAMRGITERDITARDNRARKYTTHGACARGSPVTGELRLRAALYATDGVDRAVLEACLPITTETGIAEIRHWATPLGEQLLNEAGAFWPVRTR